MKPSANFLDVLSQITAFCSARGAGGAKTVTTYSVLVSNKLTNDALANTCAERKMDDLENFMPEAAIAFAWTVSVCSLFLFHSHKTLQLHATQRVVDGRCSRRLDPDRARTQAVSRAVASCKCHEVGSAQSAQFSATPTSAPEADSHFCQGQR